MSTNGSSTNGTSVSRPFTDGVYCPLITPFTPGSEELDVPALQKQVVRLAKAGMGLVLLGTNGEGKIPAPSSVPSY